jgi:hypothetical protein
VTLSYLSFHRQALASKAFSTWLPWDSCWPPQGSTRCPGQDSW